eukprot:Em0020g284a
MISGGRRLLLGVPTTPAFTTRSAPLIGGTLTHWTVLRPPLVSSLSSQAARDSAWRKGNRATLTYVVALAVAVVGMSYAAVPLYRLFCQASGYGGTVKKGHGGKVEHMKPVTDRLLTIKFNADTSATMQWQFKPQQREIKVVPGETALAFYTAYNPTDSPVIGISTYNVIPFEAGQYFNKIQCFCFEEQRLNPKEQVDMPVFFYIDPEFSDDPLMAKVDTITLSYTFFEAKEAEHLKVPPPIQSTVAV